jgi:hypothetical protein
MNETISRRSFLGKGFAATASALPVIGAGAGGCGAGQSAPSSWVVPDRPAEPVPWAALRCGVLAPNAHNTQPWLLQVRRDGAFDLFVDSKRLLPFTDPSYRQTHVSQGTFLEVASIAARQWGHELDVEYFPEGGYSLRTLRDAPVARLRFVARPAVAKPPLFSELTKRQCNKRNYDPVVIDGAIRRVLESTGRPFGVRVQVISEPASRGRLADIASEAMRVEMTDQRRAAETVKWFRFSEQELRRKADGFGLGQNGVSGLKRWIAENVVLERHDADRWEGAFVEGAVEGAREQAHSASAFIVMSTRGGTRTDELLAGRAFARLALTVSQVGLALHPMSQAAEEFTDMAPVRADLKSAASVETDETVQMFLRVGEANTVLHTPRRKLEQMLRRTRHA